MRKRTGSKKIANPGKIEQITIGRKVDSNRPHCAITTMQTCMTC